METGRKDSAVSKSQDPGDLILQFDGGSLISIRLVAERVRRILAFRGYRLRAGARRSLEQETLAEIRQAANGGLDPRVDLWRFVDVASLRRCIDWLRDREAQSGTRDEHVPSVLIARAVVAAKLVTTAERAVLEGHLATCAVCRNLHHLSVAAFNSARAAGGGAAVPRRVLAATLVAVLVMALAFGLSRWIAVLREQPVPVPEIARRTATTPRPAPESRATLFSGEGVRSMSGESFAGKRRIESERVLVARDVLVESGAELILRAGTAVVLGDGFTVAADAVLVVEIVDGSPRNLGE